MCDCLFKPSTTHTRYSVSLAVFWGHRCLQAGLNDRWCKKPCWLSLHTWLWEVGKVLLPQRTNPLKRISTTFNSLDWCMLHGREPLFHSLLSLSCPFMLLSVFSWFRPNAQKPTSQGRTIACFQCSAGTAITEITPSCYQTENRKNPHAVCRLTFLKPQDQSEVVSWLLCR